MGFSTTLGPDGWEPRDTQNEIYAAAVVGAAGGDYPQRDSTWMFRQSAIARAMETVYLFWDVPMQTGCTLKPVFTTYIDAVDGNDAWDGSRPTWEGGTVGPKRTTVVANWTGSKTSWFSDEILLLRAGTNQFGRTTVGGYRLGQEHIHTDTSNSLLITTRKHLGAYWVQGDDPLARPVFRSLKSAGVGNARAVLSASGTLSDIIVRDVIIDAQDVANRHGLFFYDTANGHTLNNITIENVDIIGGSINDGSARVGIGASYFGQYARLTPYSVSKNILVANCHAFGYPGHGIGFYGTFGEQLANGKWHGVDIVGCTSIGCGAGYDCHGFTSYSGGVLLGWSGTWVLHSGTVYYHDIDARYGRDLPDIEICYMQDGAGGQVWQFTKNITVDAGSVGTLPTGEFWFDVGTTGAQRLYVNHNGVVDSSKLFSTCVRATKGIRYIRCLAMNTINAGLTLPAFEGHGFAFDDFTSYCSMIECASIGNQGAGATLNRGNAITLIGCNIHGNGLGPVKGNFGWGHAIARSRLSGTGFSDTFPPYKGFVHLAHAGARNISNVTPISTITGCELEYTGADKNVALVLGVLSGPLVVVNNCVMEPGVGMLSQNRVIVGSVRSPTPVPVTSPGFGIA